MPLFKRNDTFAGRYILNELIGEGSFSEIWKARDQMAEDAVVALKICTSENQWNEEALRQFKRQFSLSQQLSHPHLLKVSHFDVSEGLPYLVMPLCPKGSLAKLVKEEGSFSERQVALVLSQIGSALEALHQQEPPLLHGNIKPDNIVAAQVDYFFLADYGNGKESEPWSAGSPSAAYAPPESFDRFQQTGPSGDIFSLGVTLYEIATNTLPWTGKGGKALLQGEKVPVLPKRYSTELNELLQACMSTNKNKRPSAQELHLRAKQFLETGHWTLPEKGEEKQKPLKKRIPYLLAAAIFVLLILGAFWGIQNNYLSPPLDRHQKGTESGLPPQEQDIEEMLIATLEDQLKEMTSRAMELEEENQQLKQMDGLANARVEKPALLVEEKQELTPQKNGNREAEMAKPKNVLSPSIASPKKENTSPLPEDFEKQLNKASDPGITGQAREAWKRETLNQFSDGTVQIVDITDGTPKRYSTRIFVNLLYRVPHTVVVKEVKRDRNQKITELRLEMQPNG